MTDPLARELIRRAHFDHHTRRIIAGTRDPAIAEELRGRARDPFAAFAATVVAWFSIVITGRYPSGLFAFNVRAWRFLVRANCYRSMLLVDARPPLSGRVDPGYPLQADVTPLPEYNRLLTAFRFPLLIPLCLMTYIAMAVAFVAWFPSLFTITIFRYQPASLQRVIAWAMRIDAKFIASTFLLTQTLWIAD